MDEQKTLALIWEWHTKLAVRTAEEYGRVNPQDAERCLMLAHKYSLDCPATYEELIEKEEAFDHMIKEWESMTALAKL